jgi:DNA modification methylase
MILMTSGFKKKNDGRKNSRGIRPGVAAKGTKVSPRGPDKKRSAPASKHIPRKPPVGLQTTTLWDYPSQHYGDKMQGDKDYVGATPSYVIWNLLMRYTREGDKILDPMCGSGTTLDVCKDLKRDGIGFDISPYRDDIKQGDARHLPLKSGTVDFVFIDPPYSTHIKYSGHARCIGELDARGGGYYEAMTEVLVELARLLKPGGHLGLYVSDSFQKGQPFCAIGFELFQLMKQKAKLEPIDIVAVTRRNKTLMRNNWHTAASDGNYFLRGFNYLFIMQKPKS